MLDDFYTQTQLATRWAVSEETIRRLTARGVLSAVMLPGRRSASFSKESIAALEREYRGPASGHRRAIAADDALRSELRSRECWSEFARQISPLDPDHSLIEKMMAAKLANDPGFGPDDVETFVSDKRSEYASVRALVEKQAKESQSVPEMRRLAGGAK